MAREVRSSTWQRALVALSSTVIGVVIVTALYWGRAVFIPLALAIFLTFVLSPLVTFLQRRGCSHVLALVVVVALTVLVVASISWAVAQQAFGLIDELPEHTDAIKAKIQAVRERFQGLGGRLGEMADEIGAYLKGEGGAPAAAGLQAPEQGPVVVRPSSPPWLAWLSSVGGQVLELLGKFALGVVLFIFMLAKRSDMRNRFIRLAGVDQMTVTTKALDDAAQRVSRYLLTQAIINGTFGLAMALGLFVLGVPHAFLWGFLAGVLRYAPYVGAPIAALFPITMSMAFSDNWLQPILVIALLLALELTTNNLMEPLLYGHSMGVSEVAQVTSAAFWAFLWGPIGLVLSGPITVCLLVLGKNVPQLNFLEVLLGHEPALTPDVSYYQRLTARDYDEAAEIVQARLKEERPEQVYDELMIPALNHTGRDRDRGDLFEDDEHFICNATRELIEDIHEQLGQAADEDGPGEANGTTAHARVRILACPAHDCRDLAALDMFQQVLNPRKWDTQLVDAVTLAAELIARVEKVQPAVVCIGSLPPGGVAHTRYLCKRLRSRFPKLRILVGRWGQHDRTDEVRDLLLAAGADHVETSLLSSRQQLQTWFSLLALKSASSPASAKSLETAGAR